MKKYLLLFGLISLLLYNSCNKATDKNGTLKIALSVPDSLVVDPNHFITVTVYTNGYTIKDVIYSQKNGATATLDNLYPDSYLVDARLQQTDLVSHHNVVATVGRKSAVVKPGEVSTITLSDWY